MAAMQLLETLFKMLQGHYKYHCQLLLLKLAKPPTQIKKFNSTHYIIHKIQLFHLKVVAGKNQTEDQKKTFFLSCSNAVYGPYNSMTQA